MTAKGIAPKTCRSPRCGYLHENTVTIGGSKQAQQSEVGELDVDVYLIKFDEDSLAENRSGLEFYIKLAIDPEEPTVAIVSFHLSGSP